MAAKVIFISGPPKSLMVSFPELFVSLTNRSYNVTLKAYLAYYAGRSWPLGSQSFLGVPDLLQSEVHKVLTANVVKCQISPCPGVSGNKAILNHTRVQKFHGEAALLNAAYLSDSFAVLRDTVCDL